MSARVTIVFLILFLLPSIRLAAGGDSVATLENAIKEYVLSRSATGEKISVKLATLAQRLPQNLPADLQVSCFKTGEIIGRTLFTVSYKGDGRMVDSFTVVADVDKYCHVLVLTRNVDRHQILTEEMFTVVQRPARWARRERPLSADEAIGKRTNRLLLKGRILFESMVEEVPVIERGQPATLIVFSKNMSITMPVVACQNARVGEEIKVKSEQTDQYYKAIVQDNDTVVLEL